MLPFVTDPTLHPRVMEIRDPDTQEVLGGAVFTDAEEYAIVTPSALAWLRHFPACQVANGPPGSPWREETPTYAALVDALGFEPVGVAGRTWLDLVAAEVYLDTGDHWEKVAPRR